MSAYFRNIILFSLYYKFLYILFKIFMLNYILALTLIFCQFKVNSPESLFMKVKQLASNYRTEGIPFQYGQFGKIYFDATIQGQVYAVDQDDENVICRKVNDDVFRMNGKSKGNHNKILIVQYKEEKCRFVKLAQVAEEAGADLLIIVDDNKDNNEWEKDYLNDDVNSQHINIPAIIIQKSIGQEIIKAAQQNESAVYISLKIKTPKVDYTSLKIFINNFNMKTFFLLTSLSEIEKKLLHYDEEKSKIHVYFHTSECDRCGTQDQLEKIKVSDCVSQGKYCDKKRNIYFENGENQIQDFIYQSCMIEKNGVRTWLEYANKLYSKCISEELSYYNCHEEVLAPYNTTEIYDCYEKSYVASDIEYGDNTILKHSRDVAFDKSIFSYPTILVNGISFNGDLSKHSLLYEFICNSYIEHPQGCKEFFENQVDHEGNIATFEKVMDGYGFWVYFLLTIFLIGLFICIVYCLRRRVHMDTKNQATIKVISTIDQYYKMQNESKGTELVG